MTQFIYGIAIALVIISIAILTYGLPTVTNIVKETDFMTIEYHHLEPAIKDDIGVVRLTVKDIEEMI